MTPPELLLASLGSCIGAYVESYCRQARIPYEDMTINIDWEKAKDPARIGKIRADVKIPSDEAKAKTQAILRAAESCLVHNTFKYPPEIGINVITV